ncbi:hypothetical protein F5X68DRAFT_258640 [Plectosphaerella plurivora]|uniref:Uncharacterized protein n=1 Tax=Plectosphaerella plurivora TaxID=936078 RepID=A0A9P8VIM1_9PEZI|nr:hypothetical protein F5X68DRAFT_258640 [Plectosphaerella plurivora]
MASHGARWFSASLRQKLFRATQLAVGAPLVTFGGLYLWTRRCSFEPFGPETSPLYQHPILKIINPRNNPSSDDCCVRSVPFSDIKPNLLKDARRGGTSLIEAFCGGYEIQRNLMHLTKHESSSNDLWTSDEIRNSKFEPGTVITNHFIVLEKTPTALTFRGCLGPRQTPMAPQDLDNLFELSAVVNEEKKVVEFRLKCITFDGTDLMAREDPFGGFPGLLHRQYAKLLVEAAAGNCTK